MKNLKADFDRLVNAGLSVKEIVDIMAAVRGPDGDCDKCKRQCTALVRASAFRATYSTNDLNTGWFPYYHEVIADTLVDTQHIPHVCSGGHFYNHYTRAKEALERVGLWKHWQSRKEVNK